MEDLKSKILEHCQTHYDDIVEIRRDLHKHPETGFEVERTANIAATELEKLGIKVKTGVGKTGVVGDIEIPGANRRIALRADMDALPIQELGNPAYKSQVEGKAHMCGHDAHTAILIGAARVINSLKEELKANVRFVFQPSEEQFPGGAPGMIEDGVLEGVDEIYGLHVWPMTEVGHYAITPGPFLAQADSFEIEIEGKGGHAAFPHFTNDPIIMGSQFVNLLQSIVSRNVDPLDSAVVSVTTFHAGDAFNVIAPSVKITGTVRTLKKETKIMVRDKIESLLAAVTSGHDGTYQLAYQDGYPVTYNHQPCAENALEQARMLVGDEKTVYPVAPALGGEDFGYYSEKIPACYIGLGSRNKEKGLVNMCHHPEFDIDEECIIHGIALHTSLALNFE